MKRLLMFSIMAILLSSCTSYVEDRWDQLTTVCDQHKGKNIQDIILRWGQPTSISKCEGITIYQYRWDYGIAFDYSMYTYGGNTSTREKHDTITLMVKDGIILNSKVAVQR